MHRLQPVLLLTIGLLAGCGQVSMFGHPVGEKSNASEVKTEPVARPDAVVNPESQKVKTVTLVLTPQIAATLAKDSRFNAGALLDAIKSELRSRQVLDDTDAHASNAEIAIDGLAIKPVSNVILFGKIISDSALTGEIRVRDEHGVDKPAYRIEAEAKVSISASGEDKNPLALLYQQFALLAGNHLAGFPAKPNSGFVIQPPR